MTARDLVQIDVPIWKLHGVKAVVDFGRAAMMEADVIGS